MIDQKTTFTCSFARLHPSLCITRSYASSSFATRPSPPRFLPLHQHPDIDMHKLCGQFCVENEMQIGRNFVSGGILLWLSRRICLSSRSRKIRARARWRRHGHYRVCECPNVHLPKNPLTSMRLCRVTTGVASLRRERMAIAKGGNGADVNDNRPALPNHYQGWHPGIVSLVDAILLLFPQFPQLSSSLCSYQHPRSSGGFFSRLYIRSGYFASS